MENPLDMAILDNYVSHCQRVPLRVVKLPRTHQGMSCLALKFLIQLSCQRSTFMEHTDINNLDTITVSGVDRYVQRNSLEITNEKKC